MQEQITLTRDGYLLTEDKLHFDFPAIVKLVQTTYWASQRTMETIIESIFNSVCLVLMRDGKTIGFVRALTDKSVNSYICDFVIDEAYRGKDLGTWMLEALMSHPDLVRTNQLLITKDAMPFYERHGFAEHPYVCMKRPRRVPAQR